MLSCSSHIRPIRFSDALYFNETDKSDPTHHLPTMNDLTRFLGRVSGSRARWLLRNPLISRRVPFIIFV